LSNSLLHPAATVTVEATSVIRILGAWNTVGVYQTHVFGIALTGVTRSALTA